MALCEERQLGGLGLWAYSIRHSECVEVFSIRANCTHTHTELWHNELVAPGPEFARFLSLSPWTPGAKGQGSIKVIKPTPALKHVASK